MFNARRFFPFRYFNRYFGPAGAEAAVGSDLAISYGLRETVGSSLLLRWRLGEAVQPIEPVYGVGGGEPWHPGPLPRPVGSNLMVFWQTRNVVASDLAIPTRFTRPVGSTIVLPVRFTMPVSVGLEVRYRVDEADFYLLNRRFLFEELEEDEVIINSWMQAA